MSYPANLTRSEIDEVKSASSKRLMAVIALVKPAAEKVLSK